MSDTVAPVVASRPDRIAVPPASTVRRLVGRPVGAAWGDQRLLADLVDVADHDDPSPIAEVWYGAHARHPAWVTDGGTRVAADALAEHEQPGPLLKLLAAAGPLSIQVHPDAASARRRWDEEEAAGIPRDAPARRSADPLAKPELVRAVGSFRALCGFRPAVASRALLSALVPHGAEPLLEHLALGDAGLGSAVDALLRSDPASVGAILDAVAAGARDVLAASTEGSAAPEAMLERLAELALDLVERFPGDPGVLVALLLEDVDLAPGDTLFVAPGTPHAYLSGLAVEVMASSDNVLRGGMTTKPIDVDAFLEALDARAVGAPRTGTLPRRVDGSGWRRHIIPSDAFLVDEAEIDGVLLTELMGGCPSVVLCVSGEVEVSSAGSATIDLRAGGAALLAPGPTPVEVRGRGLVLHVGTARRPGAPSPALSPEG